MKGSLLGLFAKRTLDIAVAALLSLIALPVIIVACLAIKLTSKGPVIFKQERVGKDQKRFICYKFRSMYANASTDIHQNFIRNSMRADNPETRAGNVVHKLVGDTRITPIGKFIRKTSIDELPQLWNVLKGEMGMVGPRPTIPYELEHFKGVMFERFKVKPGITGLWQVSGRNMLSYQDMVRLDIEYINDWSFISDVKILLKTVVVICFTRWAH